MRQPRIGLALLLPSLLARPVRAVDVTGTWRLFFDGSFLGRSSATAAFVQPPGAGLVLPTGTILPAGPALVGFFDQAERRLGMETLPPTDGFEVIVAATGDSFSGQWGHCSALTCDPPGLGGTCRCTGTLTSGGASGCRAGAGDCCGDGVVDPTEDCDPGPGGDRTCCDDTCHFATSGTACSTDGDACTDDVCDGAGTCTHPALPDSDGDGLCDAVDPCTFPIPASRTAIRLSGFATPALPDDRLAFRAELPFGAPLTPGVDPLAYGLRLVIDRVLGAQALTVDVPPGAYDGTTGWKVNRPGTLFTFRSPTPVAGAVTRAKVQLVTRTPGLVKVEASGTRGTFATAVPTLPLAVTVVLDPVRGAGGRCGGAAFPGPRPAPSCQFDSPHLSVTCR